MADNKFSQIFILFSAFKLISYYFEFLFLHYFNVKYFAHNIPKYVYVGAALAAV